MTFMNTISPTIKYTFTYSKQTVTFLDVKIYLSKNRKLKTKLYRKPTDCMTLLHFHSHHPLSYKESIIYSQTLRYNMIISEDHILQKEFNNLTRVLHARAYPLHLIIKNIKKPWPTAAVTCHPNAHPHTLIRTYPQWYTHGDTTTVVTPVFSSIPDTPNSSWCHGQWMERQDILWRSWYHTTLMLLIWEVQLRIVNFNIFGSNNITLHNL